MSEPRPLLVVLPLADGWSVEGEIDAHSAQTLAAAFTTLPAVPEIIVDVAGVTFMDSSGLRLVVDVSQRAHDAGSTLVLLHPQAALRRVVEVSGLTDHLNLRD